MENSTADLTVGTVVSYEDQANPLRVGKVTRIVATRWGTEYEVTFGTFADGRPENYISDCRQAGWKVVAPAWWVAAGLPAEDFGKVSHDLDEARREADRRLSVRG